MPSSAHSQGPSRYIKGEVTRIIIRSSSYVEAGRRGWGEDSNEESFVSSSDFIVLSYANNALVYYEGNSSNDAISFKGLLILPSVYNTISYEEG